MNFCCGQRTTGQRETRGVLRGPRGPKKVFCRELANTRPTKELKAFFALSESLPTSATLFLNKMPSLPSRGGGARPREQMVSKCRTVGSSRPHPCQGGNILLKLKHFIFNFEVFQFLCRYNLDFFSNGCIVS